jgi:hypothetical protein
MVQFHEHHHHLQDPAHLELLREHMSPVLGPLLVHGCESRPLRSHTIRRQTRCPSHQFALLRLGSMANMSYLVTPVESFGFDRIGKCCGGRHISKDPRQPIRSEVVSGAASVNRRYSGCLDRFSRALRSASVPGGDRAGRIGRPQTNSLCPLQGLERCLRFGKHQTARSCELNPAVKRRIICESFRAICE